MASGQATQVTQVTASPVRGARVLPLVSLATILAGTALIVLLQVLPPTNAISPVRRTISEYGLSTNKWIFDLAVVLVAFGSAAAFGALIHHRLVPPLSAPAVFSALWTVSLLVIVAFPKHNWAIGPSAGGSVHRVASVVGFICLPIAVLLAARRVFPRSSARRLLAQGLAVTSLLWFGVIITGVGVMLGGGPPWWVFVPIGLVERLMSLNELLATAALTVPLLRRPGWT
jgi:hypothetical protein